MKLKLLKVLAIISLIPFFHACEDKLVDPDYPMSEAEQAIERLTDGGKTLPTGRQLAEELSNPGSGIQGDCHRVQTEQAEETFLPREGNYKITSQEQKKKLIDKIIEAGPNRMSTTEMTMPDGSKYEVMNDNVTLPDGTYVPLSFPESKEIAAAWGWSLPNASQAKAIGKYAYERGTQFKAITRTPNNNQATQFKSMNEMMNDSRMHQRAKAGQERLIDGHFKWYTDTGKIYGFARGDGRFWQNTPSGAHVGDPQYYDYSHGVRLIRKVQ
jgi:uncharacterized protein YgiM (DUF1202 family)